MVNLSKIRIIPDTFRTWEQIQGMNTRFMTAGYTESSSIPPRDHKDVRDLIRRPHDAYKIIALNDDQESLLFENIRRAVFFNDFGAGKENIHRNYSEQFLFSPFST